MVCPAAQPLTLRRRAPNEVQQTLVDLARVRQHNHVGKRLALAKAAAGRAFLDESSVGCSPERQMQAQLLGADAERGERLGVGDGDEGLARHRAARRGART